MIGSFYCIWKYQVGHRCLQSCLMSEILGGLHVHVPLYMRTLRADMGGLNGFQGFENFKGSDQSELHMRER